MNLHELFEDYKTKEAWEGVDKSHENLFVIGAQAILLRNGKILNDFIESKSHEEWHLFNDAQQEQIIKGFKEYSDMIILNK